MGYSLAITAYCQTCNRSHRAKDNEHRRISRIPESNCSRISAVYPDGIRGHREKVLQALGDKVFPTRYQPLTMVVYIT